MSRLKQFDGAILKGLSVTKELQLMGEIGWPAMWVKDVSCISVFYKHVR